MDYFAILQERKPYWRTFNSKPWQQVGFKYVNNKEFKKKIRLGFLTLHIKLTLNGLFPNLDNF